MQPKLVITSYEVSEETCRTRRYPHSMKRSEVYVWLENESIGENMMNRRNRPYTEWKKVVLPYLKEKLGRDNIKLSWDQHCGCRCPCSPGFRMTEGPMGMTIHIKVKYVTE